MLVHKGQNQMAVQKKVLNLETDKVIRYDENILCHQMPPLTILTARFLAWPLCRPLLPLTERLVSRSLRLFIHLPLTNLHKPYNQTANQMVDSIEFCVFATTICSLPVDVLKLVFGPGCEV